jgi:hypothetical protein
MPARTPENENITRNAENNAQGQANQSFTAAQQDLTQANQDQTNLRAGKMVGADPYLNPQYLAAVNRLRSGSLNEATNAGDQQVRALNARTGGMNGTATTGAIAKLALDKARLGNQLGSEQTAGDWTKNIGYQLTLAQQPLEAARAQAPFYGSSTGLVGATNSDLTKYGTASQAFNYELYNKELQAAMNGVGAAAG